jgi:hypothetical protein
MKSCYPLFVFAVLLFAFAAQAQITGDLRGIVTDPSGAAVPGVPVKLASTETGESRSAATDAEGRYSFNLLKIGAYTVTVEAQGFRRAVAGATVRSAEIAAVNLRLEIGQVSEQVVVTDAVNPLDTQSAQMQGAFETKEVQELPVGRNPNLLAATMPGVVPAPGGFNSGSFVSNGNRVRANNITIDNITATDISVAGTGGGNNNPLNFSSIKEVKIITNNFSAEFGRNSGSQVQYITKSGTNDFHGEAYEYLQNNEFNARDWFDRSGAPTVSRINQYGGVFGGPILRNKTHFFGSGEKNPVRGSGSARIAQVPTAAMLAAVTDPTSKKILDQYKLPAATSESSGLGNVQQNAPNAGNFRQYSVRIDHQISSKDSIYGRFGGSESDASSSNNTFIQTNISNFGLKSTNGVYSVNLNETHIFSPNVVNEFRSGYGRSSPMFEFDSNLAPGPRIIFSNNDVDRFGHYEGGPQGRVQNTYQYGDTLTWTRGAHTLKFGGEFFRYQGNSVFDVYTRGMYTFLNWSDFAAGIPNQFTERFGGTVRGHRAWLSDGFAQDDYRLTPSLTLNLGFRLETYGPVREVNQLSSNLDFNCRDSLGAAGAGQFGCFTVGNDITSTNYYAQPRIGVAWNPRGGKTVIRGGYGLVADFNFLNPITNQRSLPPFIITQSLSGAAAFSGANSWASLIAGTAQIQREGASMVGRIRNDVLNYGDVSPVIDPGLQNPQVHQWSFGVQRQLPNAIVLKVGYAGTKGNYLQRHRQLNFNARQAPAAVSLADEAARLTAFVTAYNSMTGSAQRSSTRLDPRFNVVNYYDNSANSNYHALEVQAMRSFRNGYSFQAAYTFAKSIDDVSDSLSNLPNDSANIQDPTNFRNNRGISAFSLPHRVVVSNVWELPWGSKLANPALRGVLGGWSMSGISQWRTGFPISFDASARLGVANISGITTAGVGRPNAAGPVNFNPVPTGSAGAPTTLVTETGSTQRLSAYAVSLGLSQPLLGNFGMMGRNTHRTIGQANFDWNLYKTVRIRERLSLVLRCEAYNLFNNHTFQDVNRNITNTAFGQYTTTPATQSSRFLQLGAVVRF